MTTAQQNSTSLTADQADLILDITEKMMRTGHTVSVSIDSDSITVNGDKAAALGRCAVITGQDIEWIY